MRIRTTGGTPRRLVHISAAAAALLAPAAIADAASAATLHVNKACYVVSSKKPPVMVVTGSGFAPGGAVTVAGGRTVVTSPGQATVDGAGQFAVKMGILPAKTTVIPQATILTASEGAVKATTKAHVTFRGVVHGGTRKLPGLRAFSEKTKWQFSGFAPGRSIWGHYTTSKRQVARQAFGRAVGPCGALTVHKALYPGTAHHSSYGLQFDQSRSYSRKTRIKVTGTLKLTTVF